MSEATFHFAEEYVQRGYSVVPLVGKVPPAGFRWARYQQRRTTMTEIRDWFGPTSCSRYDIGIVTGCISGITVVDLDSKDEVRWWTTNFPQTPLVAITGRGGAHMYYRANPTVQVRNRAGLLDRKIDIRGEGGYVVAPPSMHEVTGSVYQWHPWQHYSLEEIPSFDPSCLDLDDNLSAMLRTTSQKRLKTSILNGPAYISHIYAISGEGGHNATFRAACYLREAGMSPEEALRALTAWNKTNCRPVWIADELVHKVRDAFRIQRQ